MNKVVHFEIPADDLKRAQTFYADVFGWKIQHIPEMGYAMAYTVETDEHQTPKEVGAINGGMYQREKDLSQSPVIVVNVPSIDAHVKKIEAAGGKIVRPKRQVADMGLYAQVSDTEGNIVGIWEDLKR